MNGLLLAAGLIVVLAAIVVIGGIWSAANRDGDVDGRLDRREPEDFTHERDAA